MFETLKVYFIFIKWGKWMMKNSDVFLWLLRFSGSWSHAGFPGFRRCGVNTLGHISDCRPLPYSTLQKLGLANILWSRFLLPQLSGLIRKALWKRQGHHDRALGMMGLEVNRPFKTFTETGFLRAIRELENEPAAQSSNKAPSEIEILDELAEEEIATGHKDRLHLRIPLCRSAEMKKPFGLEWAVSSHVRLPENWLWRKNGG